MDLSVGSTMYIVIKQGKINDHHNVSYVCGVKSVNRQFPIDLTKVKTDNIYFDDTCKYVSKNTLVFKNKETIFVGSSFYDIRHYQR